MTLRLESSAFRDGERIPVVHTCEGDDISPPLAWSGSPDGTRSFALVCADPDAPAGTWYHWGIFNIPATSVSLARDYPRDARAGPIRQAISDFRRPGWGGPCPPKGHGLHRYQFRLWALDVALLDLAEKIHCRELEKAAQAHALAEALLTGTYSR